MRVSHRVLAVLCLIASMGGATTSCRRSTGPDPTPVCSITLAPPNRSFSPSAGDGTVNVTASAASCPWTAAAGASWITITAGASGTGSGAIQYSVAANESASTRVSVITVGEQAHTITQQGQSPCTYSLSPTDATIDPAGAGGSFVVNTTAGCSWTAQSNAEWLVIVSGAEGTGSGAVSYQAGENPGTGTRSADIVVADQKFTLTQLGQSDPEQCTYTVDPTQFSPCMAEGTLTTRVETQDICKWTVVSDVPWMTITTGESGTGSSNIVVTYTDNYDAPREGLLKVRWPTSSAGQNVRVAQAGCVYGTSQSVFAFDAGGGTGSFTVVQQSQPYECGGPLQNRCVWSATPTAPWITVTSSMPRVGDDMVSFTVTVNTLPTPRTGTIVVRDRIVEITQAGAP
jgi:hypothetical protein